MEKLGYYEGRLKIARRDRRVAKRNLEHYKRHGFTQSILMAKQAEFDRADGQVRKFERIIAEIKG
jgi:hypothetical protein